MIIVLRQTHPFHLIYSVNNVQEDRYAPRGGNQVTSIKCAIEKQGDSIPANSAEEARLISIAGRVTDFVDCIELCRYMMFDKDQISRSRLTIKLKR